MSNVSLIIEERPHQMGKFLVGRLLPFTTKKMVGPFVFIDHMGPVSLNEFENFDVPPHPHIGLSTLTYLFEGSIMHRDSLGNTIEIKPGEVNLMTAGNGIVHSERTPEYLRNSTKHLHGLQIWLAMPKALEQNDPGFAHIGANELPKWSDGSVSYTLIAGEALGKKSPVPVLSKLFLIEIKSTDTVTIDLGEELYGEAAMYILDGAVIADDIVFEPKRILVASETKLCRFTLRANSTIYIFGGNPFEEPRYIYWNFVATSRELIEQAKDKWQQQTFPKIDGETEFVPLPISSANLKK
jgi:redox-sensitive bicupin YhaK (pirin superfamily)